MCFIITIEQVIDQEGGGIEVYRRRAEAENINFVIQRLDRALNIRTRKRRRDLGQPRTESTSNQS
jgi:hypothetical protein